MDQYCKNVLKVVVAQICQTMGWHKIQSTPLDVMVDILSRYLNLMCGTTHKYSELYGLTEPNLIHIGLMMRDLHIQVNEIEEYINWVEPMPCTYSIPRIPVRKEPSLNFLKPGSREVVTRPVYVHEHLPPMYPELETQESSPVVTSPSELGVNSTIGLDDIERVKSPDQLTNGTELNNIDDIENVFKRPGDPLTPVDTKRTKLSFGEEGRPTREISSVMMTTSGFLSPAREGKLPEARTPQVLSESQTSPVSHYPTVPPELRVEKKIKRIDLTDGGGKRIKEIQQIQSKGSDLKNELFRPDKLINISGSVKNDKINKLITLKAKENNAKQLKTIKQQALNNLSLQNNTSIEIISKSNLVAVTKQIPSETRIQKITPNMITKPIKIEDPPMQPTITSQTIEPGVTIIEIDDKGVRKLSNEPDKVKLNIFKKISSKIKDDKMDKYGEKSDKKPESHFDLVAAVGSRDIHAVDIIPINEMLDSKPKVEKSKSPEITIKEEQVYPNVVESSLTSTSISYRPPTFDVDINPRTPDILQSLISTSARIKGDKEKKRRKEKIKKINKHKLKALKGGTRMKRKMALNINDAQVTRMLAESTTATHSQTINLLNQQRPKTPEDPQISILNNLQPNKVEINSPTQPVPPPPLFSMFPQFPSGPGLIPKLNPKQIYPPFFPRPHSALKHGFGQPPILPSSTLINVTTPIINSPPPTSSPPSAPVAPSQSQTLQTSMSTVSSSSSSVSLISSKVSSTTPTITPESKLSKSSHQNVDVIQITPIKGDKKNKEHKKDKKDKLEKKIRKKKDKKEKKKGKDKAEKKLEKEGKKLEKEKLKLKKEKKDKHKEKHSMSETSVPKLTLKLGPQSQRESTPDGQITRKITIKTVTKKGSNEDLSTMATDREMSPELARISALVTRPPKTSKSSSAMYQSSEVLFSSSGGGYHHHHTHTTVHTSTHTLPSIIPSNDFQTKLKQSMFGQIPKLKTRILMKKSAAADSTTAEIAVGDNCAPSPKLPSSAQTPFIGAPTNPPPHPAQRMPVSEAFYFDKDGNKVWICPACGRQDDGTPMIGCDDCDAWYHWVCVGIQVPPDDNEDWYCKVCIAKKQESIHSDKKKKRKKREKKEH